MRTKYSHIPEGYFKQTFEASWVDYASISEQEKSQLLTYYKNACNNYTLFDDTKELLEKVKSQVDTVFLISNISNLYIPVVEKLWLPNYFQFILYSCNFWAKKNPQCTKIFDWAYEKLNNNYEIFEITRDNIYKNKKQISNKIKSIKNDFIIVDIWWYFAKIINFLSKDIWNKLIWVVEDTENWYQKYKKYNKTGIPILSVARSILKEPEDFLVWQSIVFSTDYVLRKNNSLLNNKKTWIIWFWKIWKSIATELKWKNIQLSIFDKDPYKWIEVLTYWYNFNCKLNILKNSNIIFCATWNFSLSWNDFLRLKDWVVLSSVTSSDDELDISFLENNAQKEKLNKYTTKYTLKWKTIYLLNNWNAINFINNAVVWEFIYLVQAEIIHCLWSLINKNNDNKNNSILEIKNSEKSYIATLWLKYFNI